MTFLMMNGFPPPCIILWGCGHSKFKRSSVTTGFKGVVAPSTLKVANFWKKISTCTRYWRLLQHTGNQHSNGLQRQVLKNSSFCGYGRVYSQENYCAMFFTTRRLFLPLKKPRMCYFGKNRSSKAYYRVNKSKIFAKLVVSVTRLLTL